MAHGEISEILPASSETVFDLFHDYGRRLDWDTLLSEAYLVDSDIACKGAASVCVGRRLLGSLPIKTVYITFQRPKLAAVKMINTPAFFGTWAASIHHEDILPLGSMITYKYHFTAKPRLLAPLLEPLMKMVFIWETKKRLRALRSYLTK